LGGFTVKRGLTRLKFFPKTAMVLGGHKKKLVRFGRGAEKGNNFGNGKHKPMDPEPRNWETKNIEKKEQSSQVWRKKGRGRKINEKKIKAGERG